MEIAIIVLLVAVVALLATLLVKSRKTQGISVAAAADGGPAHAAGEVSAGDPDKLIYRVADPNAIGQELLVEFIPGNLAQLTESAGVHPIEGTRTARNAIDAIVNSIPGGAAAALLESGMIMRVVGSDQAIAGYQRGILNLVTSQGGVLGVLKDSNTGQFAAHLRFEELDVTPVVGALTIFQVMSVVTGQYYLHRIDRELQQIQRGIGRLIQGQQSELVGKIEAAGRLNEQVRRGLIDGVPPNQGDLDDLNHAEQLVLSAYGEARLNVSQMLAWVEEVLSSFPSESSPGSDAGAEVAAPSKAALRELWSFVMQDGVHDAQALVYAAFVRHQNNLLSLAIEPQGDERRARILRERVEKEREEMLGDVQQLLMLEKISFTRQQLDQIFLFSVSKLTDQSDSYKDAIGPLLEIARRPDGGALPAPPPIDVPFLAEVSQGPDGHRSVAGAVLRPAEEPT